MTDIVDAALLEKMGWIENTHPGIWLKEDFLDPYGITPYRLAKATGLSQAHVSELLKAKRKFSIDSAIRIGQAVGTSAEPWFGLQTDHDIIESRRKLALQPPAAIPRLTPLIADAA